MALITQPFQNSGPATFTVDIPDEVEPTQSSFFLAAQNLQAPEGDRDWISAVASDAKVTIPAAPGEDLTVPLHETLHQPVPLADYTGHRCFRLHLNVPARETLAGCRTLDVQLPGYLDHLRLDLWILTRD